MKTYTLSILLLLFFSYQTVSQVSWQNYTNNIQVNDILGDGDDVWVGSKGGLTRTNLITGEFQNILAGNSPIVGGGILQIEKAPNGSIWFVSENAGVFNYINGEWKHYYQDIITADGTANKDLQILPNGDVWFMHVASYPDYNHSLFRISNGIVQNFKNFPSKSKTFCALDENTIYIAYENEILKYDIDQSQVIENFNVGNSVISSNDKFSKLLLDRNGNIFIPTLLKTFQIKDNVLSILRNTGINELNVFKGANGNIYVQNYYSSLGNSYRLSKYDGFVFTDYTYDDFAPYPANSTPKFLNADNQGNLYARLLNADSDYHVSRFNGSIWTPIKSETYPMDNYQRDVQSDCDGNLWFANRNGVQVKYLDGTWEHFPIDVGLYQNFSSGNMTIDPITCDVWFANIGNGGGPTIPGIIKISDGTITEFLYGYDGVHDIEASEDGKIYFSGGLGRIGYIENDAVHFIQEFDESDFISSLAIDSKGNVYFVGWWIGLVKYDGDSFSYLGMADDIDYTYEVFVDNEDFVWITTDNGLYQHDGLNWINYNNAWPESISISGIIQDYKGNYWISTLGDGLFYWDKTTAQKYDLFNSGMTSNYHTAVHLDPFENLIVSHSVGVSVLNIRVSEISYGGTGKVFYDFNKNGSYEESLDILIPSQKVKNTESGNWAFTNISGEYKFHSNSINDYVFTHHLENSTESTTDNPQNGTLHINQGVLPYFGYWVAPEPEVGISIFNGIPICNREFKVQVNLINKGIETINGQLILRFNDALNLVEASSPINQQTADEIIFENIELAFLQSKNFTVTFVAPGIEVDETSIFFDAIFKTGDYQVTTSTPDEILCAYDPNDKKVEPTGEFIENYSLIEDALKYTIRFQNEGTYKAFDVLIIDTLDNQLDLSTFQLLGSSHRLETSLTSEGIVSFKFPDINLPPKEEDEAGSQGFVSFKIKAQKNVENNTLIENNASIYFDYNPPIVTNTVEWNLVDDLGFLSTDQKEKNISVYPNPSDGNIIIELDKKAEFEILNITGQIIEKGQLNFGNNSIKLDALPGAYILRITDDTKNMSSTKFLII